MIKNPKIDVAIIHILIFSFNLSSNFLNYLGQLIVVGGSDGTHSLCTTEVFDIQEHIWKPGPTMTTCRANVAVAVLDDRLWAVGGFSGKTYNK